MIELGRIPDRSCHHDVPVRIQGHAPPLVRPGTAGPLGPQRITRRVEFRQEYILKLRSQRRAPQCQQAFERARDHAVPVGVCVHRTNFLILGVACACGPYERKGIRRGQRRFDIGITQLGDKNIVAAEGYQGEIAEIRGRGEVAREINIARRIEVHGPYRSHIDLHGPFHTSIGLETGDEFIGRICGVQRRPVERDGSSESAAHDAAAVPIGL